MRSAVALAALAILAGCLEQGAPPSADDPPLPTKTPTETTPTPSATPAPTEARPSIRSLASGAMAGTREEARLVFTQSAEFEAFWSRVREDDAAAPAVDFAAETVVAAISDARPNSCWSLRITNATADAVEVTTFRPPPDLMCAAVITHPWHVVALSGADRSVAFIESEAQGPPASH